MNAPNVEPTPTSLSAQQVRRYLIIGGIVLALLLAAAVWAVIAMLGAPAQTETLRDIAIVLVAVEALVIGVALIILIVQVAMLTNMLKNEVRPILLHADETVRTVRGTTAFLSDQMVRPVVRLYGFVAAVRQAIQSLRPE